MVRPPDAPPGRRPLRLLIVEDSEEDAELLLAELADAGFDVTHVRVQTASDMQVQLAAQTWDLVISDYSMPGFDGIKALSILKASGVDIPLIIASGTIGEESAVEALKSGAADFVVKGRMIRLIPAIERELREAAGRRARRNIKETLSETRERMRFALDAASLGTWEIDFASGWTMWSDVMQEQHGLLAGRFGGTLDAFAACIHEEDRQRVLDAISQSFEERSDLRLEYRTTWPDGTTHWMALRGRTYFTESGQPSRAGGVGIDVTAQKDLEDRLRQSQKMEAIGGLAAGIAHDFNNLLTVLTGYCDLLSPRLADDPEGLEELGEIRRASNSAAALTRQLLAFSRRQVLAPQIVNLNTILTEKQHMLRRLVEAHVRIDLRLADDLSLVNVDAGQIEQVLFNLVINARDAMAGGGVVSIETRNVAITGAEARPEMSIAAGSYVLFSVSDTGTGLTPEVQARLFEPFFTTKERGRGTGLGLATVYGIVKQSEGHLSVRSRLGQGTTFEIYLPVAAATAGDAPAESPSLSPRDGLEGTETILVVEDDPALRELSERILRRHGYTVLLAGDGDGAIQLCTDYPDAIHAVLLDVIMPGRSGWEVGDWIAEHRPDTKIIYTSGYIDSPIQRLRVFASGAAFLHKPFTPDDLAIKLREALS